MPVSVVSPRAWDKIVKSEVVSGVSFRDAPVQWVRYGAGHGFERMEVGEERYIESTWGSMRRTLRRVAYERIGGTWKLEVCDGVDHMVRVTRLA